MGDVSIGGVPRDKIPLVWAKAATLVERAIMPASGQTLDAVYKALRQGDSQLWVVDDFLGVVVTSIVERPAHKVLIVHLLAGERFAEWIDDIDELMEKFAYSHECQAIECYGRMGWKKLAKIHTEYKAEQIVFRKVLNDV